MQVAAGPREALLPEGHALFRQCHAATIVAFPSGDLLVAFFAGEREGAGDTAIWLASRRNGLWLAPRRLFGEPGLAHWNPVLHAEGQRVWLFYKVGPDVQRWVTRVAVSADGGASWSEPHLLVPDDPQPRGPVKNKLLVLADGAWLAPGSVEDDAHWNAFVDRSADRGETWQRSDVPLSRPAEPTASETEKAWEGLNRGALWESDAGRAFAWDGVIQPSLWQSAPHSVHMLLRSTRGSIYRSDSQDGGRRWSAAYATKLPNNNSGLDLVRLTNGALLLACNPVAGNWASRTPLSLLASSDNGETWDHQLDLEAGAGEFSYPAIIASGASVHVVYTADRRTIAYREIAWRQGGR